LLLLDIIMRGSACWQGKCLALTIYLFVCTFLSKMIGVDFVPLCELLRVLGLGPFSRWVTGDSL